MHPHFLVRLRPSLLLRAPWVGEDQEDLQQCSLISDHQDQLRQLIGQGQQSMLKLHCWKDFRYNNEGVIFAVGYDGDLFDRCFDNLNGRMSTNRGGCYFNTDGHNSNC